MATESADADARRNAEREWNAEMKFPRIVGEFYCGCPLIGLGMVNRVFKTEVNHAVDCPVANDPGDN